MGQLLSRLSLLLLDLLDGGFSNLHDGLDLSFDHRGIGEKNPFSPTTTLLRNNRMPHALIEVEIFLGGLV